MPQNFNMRSMGRVISIIIHSAKFTAQFEIREMERKRETERERGQIKQINSSILDTTIWIIREPVNGGDISLMEINIRLKDFSIYITSHNSWERDESCCPNTREALCGKIWEVSSLHSRICRDTLKACTDCMLWTFWTQVMLITPRPAQSGAYFLHTVNKQLTTFQ